MKLNEARLLCEKYISQEIGKDIQVQQILKRSESVAKIYIVGGALRDMSLNALSIEQASPRDIDLVFVGQKIQKTFFDTLGGNLDRTPLGGFQWKPPNSELRFDIWELDKTIFFDELNIFPSIDNLLSGFQLNVEKLAFDVKSNLLIDGGGIQALQEKKICFNPKWVQENRLSINLARAISLTEHIKFPLDTHLKNLIKDIDWPGQKQTLYNFFIKNGYTQTEVDTIIEKAISIKKEMVHSNG